MHTMAFFVEYPWKLSFLLSFIAVLWAVLAILLRRSNFRNSYKEFWWTDDTSIVYCRMDLCSVYCRSSTAAAHHLLLSVQVTVSSDWSSNNVTFGFVPEVCSCSCFTEQKVLELWGSFWGTVFLCYVYDSLTMVFFCWDLLW